MKLWAISRTYTKLRIKMIGSAIMKISFNFLNNCYIPNKFYGIQQQKLYCLKNFTMKAHFYDYTNRKMQINIQGKKERGLSPS